MTNRIQVSTENYASAIGLLGLLTVLFVGLKLAGYIAWSWWWVLAPLWLPLVVFLALLGAVLLIVAAFEFFTKRRR